VYKQLRYMQEQDLGFGTEQMLVIHGPEVVDSTYDSKASSFKTSLTNAGIAPRVTSSVYVPGIEILWTNGIRRKDRDDGHIVFNTAMDYDFVDTYGMTMAAGRNFSRSFGTDNKALLLNETATRMLNYDKPEDAVNQEMISGRDTLRVVGVVKDYHQQGLKTAYWPMIFRLYPNAGRFYSMKVKTAQLPQTLAAVQRQYDQFFPGNPFEYFFLDDFFNQQYQAEMQFGQVFSLFSGLAIFIACLGLLGLISFTASQRTKEIGIRKVLGANVTQIIVLLSKDFLKLVLVAIVLAVPLAWYLMDQWLTNFAYRTDIGTGVFTLAGAAALLIALSTVSYRAYRAASANPVESLRTE
jgi:putative ABC transport system permease protein